MKNQNRNDKQDLKESLGIAERSGKGRTAKRLLIWGLVALMALFVVFRWGTGQDRSQTEYKTTKAQRGNLTVTVTATGNLQPTNQVDVGSEVSGTIAVVLVDYNDFVKAGQVLARLDTTKLKAQVNQSQAALVSAKAGLRQAEASLGEAEKEMARLVEVKRLSNNKMPSRQEFDAAEAGLNRARANEAMSRANIAEAEARLNLAQTDLEKATIISPINGVVLVRSVEPGQTVAATLQSPVLFTLAEDLTKMELHVDVDEADVGLVREEQQAIFTVDAYPDRTFPAQITQVRYGSQSSEGVVTYLTVLNVDNSDLSLRPGMTATADIVVQEVKDALLIPNAALRFEPPQPTAEKTSGSSGGSLLGKLFPRPQRAGQKKIEDSADRKKQRVWSLQNNEPLAVPVTTGATSGIMTEIKSGEVTPGMPLIVEMVKKEK